MGIYSLTFFHLNKHTIMKTMKLVSAICLFFTVSVGQAQIKVANTGAVGVGLYPTSLTPLSSLAIGDAGASDTKATITGSSSSTALKVQRTGSSSMVNYGINASTSVNGYSPYWNYGIKGTSYASSISPYARTYGLFGLAGNGTQSNYGVFGQLAGSASGAAVLGLVSSSVSDYTDPGVTGMYAGYFVGDVKITGLLNGVTIGSSDKRLKDKIVQLDQAKALKGILSLNPVEYNFKQRYIKGHKDSAEIEIPYYDEKSQLFTKKHYGLLAQEIQAIYPDLVYEDQEGYLAVNYTGLIPLLIQSVKELNAKVEALSPKQPAKTKSAVLNETSALNLPCVLYQNSPNPFSVSTTIKYSLSNDITSAEILIFDMQGTLIRTEPIAVNGSGSVTIEGSTLTPGMYIYTLIANGNEIDTKRMILTK